MRNSLFIPVTTLSIVLVSMGFTCNREPIENKYNFIEKINLFPAQKSYKVGDTIWLQYINPNKILFDNKTNNNITADTVSVEFQVGFNRRYNAPVNPADGFCDFISANGVNINRYLGVYGTSTFQEFGCNVTNSYDFTIGVVPKHKGIYSLDLFGVPRNVSACPKRVIGFPLSTIEYRFNLSDGNKDIYLSIPPHSRGESTKGYTESKIDSKQVYIVKVE